MPEEFKSDVNIKTVQETSELLDTNGNTLKRSGQLSSIFDKMEQGLPIDQAVKEVNEPDKKEVKKEVKEPVKVEDRKTEVPKKEEKKIEDEEISRAKLRQESEGGPAPKEEIKSEETVADDELQVLATDKPKTAKRIQALLKKVDTINSTYAETKKQAEERAVKLAELEKKLSEVKTIDPKTDEAIKKQLDELAMFRRRYDLDKDPEVKSKYDDRISGAEKPIADILSRNGAGEALIKIISDEGGWLKFSQSTRSITLKDGPIPAAEVADLILQNLPFAEKKTLESLATEQITTKREKERYFEEQQKTANDYFKKKEEEATKGTAEYQRQVDEARKMIESWNKEVKEKNDWLKEKEVPTSASPEQKAALEDDNRYTRQLNGLLKKAVETKDINGMLEVVLDSVQYYQERREHSKTKSALAAKDKELKRLQDELDKFKNGARSVSRSGSISGAGTSPAETKSNKPASLAEALDAIASGQSISDE